MTWALPIASVPFIYNNSGNPVSYNFNNYYQTPSMETLASTGMKFTNAYCHTGLQLDAGVLDDRLQYPAPWSYFTGAR